MANRAIVTVILTILVLSSRPVARARNVSEDRTPPFGTYGQAWDASASVRSQEPRAPYPLAERRPAKAEHRLMKAAAASAELGRLEPAARVASRTTRYDAEPVHKAAYSLPTATVATCTVTTSADSGPGSLRACLSQAAANGTILFDGAIFPPTAPMTITPASELPWITADHLTVDGSNAGVVLDGAKASTDAGLVIIGAQGTVIRGLQILHFGFGIVLIDGARSAIIGGDRSVGAAILGQGNLLSGNNLAGVIIQDEGTNDNRILGNYIGVDVTGTQANGNGEEGILIRSGASNNVVGGGTPGTRNLISGNGRMGVWLQDAGTTGNRIQGNVIGTDATQTAALPNHDAGIMIGYGASDSLIGGNTSDQRNLISGNGAAGVWLEGPGVTGNKIIGNYIGTNATGSRALPNAGPGVIMKEGAGSNVVGGLEAGDGNVISGNGEDGVRLENTGTDGNTIQGNIIGADVTGTRSLGNAGVGVVIHAGANGNSVGSENPGGRNLISGNADGGVILEKANTQNNRVVGNYIGTDVTGASVLGNGQTGVAIAVGASDNVIGGDTPGARNLISGNAKHGVIIQDSGTQRNHVSGNYIGTDATGLRSLANTGVGVLIAFGATGNIVGGSSSSTRNLISGNSEMGVYLQNAGTSANQVSGNFIGTDVTGLKRLGNGAAGIVIGWGAADNVIGGAVPGARNLISGNARSGVQLQNASTTGNVIAGNYIGADGSGKESLGNGRDGVFVGFGAHGNRIGGEAEAERNVIGANGKSGIWIQDTGTKDNLVVGNYIGTDVTGASSLGNGWDGVSISLGASENIIGGDAAPLRNIISGNGRDGDGSGVWLKGPQTANNVVKGNYIGTDVTGTRAIANATDGVSMQTEANDNIIGGDTPGSGNLISGNARIGVNINEDVTGNRVLGNYIGTDAAGMQNLGNGQFGALFGFGAYENSLGGEAPGAGNLISGNTNCGVIVQGPGTPTNRIIGNVIGADTTGTGPLGNLECGVWLTQGSSGNVVGPGNTITYNGAAGVTISGETTLRNTITRNAIHHNGGPPIDFVGLPRRIDPPVLDRYVKATHTLTGRACPSCRVEVFANSDAQPAGTVYLDTVTANASGAFTLALSMPPPLPFLHATVTDPLGTTSEFSSGLSTSLARLYLPIVLR